jgi:hypothetical protein
MLRFWRLLHLYRGHELYIASLQQGFTSMQQEVHSINLRVEQSQLDIQECLKHHHPSNSDDEDDAPMAEAA